MTRTKARTRCKAYRLARRIKRAARALYWQVPRNLRSA